MIGFAVGRGAIAVLASLCLASHALAQTPAAAWPERAVRIIIPFGPGAITDTVARLLADRLAQRLGKPFVVENRPGANAIVGAEAVANAVPDGYTLLMAGSSTHTVNPNLYKSLPYDPLKNFTEAGYFAGLRYWLVVQPSSPWKTVSDVVAAAKAAPGKLNYGAGNSTTVLATELFKLISGTDFTGINYKSNAAAATDLMGGSVQLIFLDSGVATPLVKSGQLRALAHTGTKRLAAFPDVPTFGEAGFAEMQQVAGWFGLWFPANTPRPIVEKFNAALNAVREQPDFVARMADFNITMDGPGNSPEEFARYIRDELARWANVVEKTRMEKQ